MRDSVAPLSEDHRYFPEWADRPEIPGPPFEADHNSYLAGGYSEEFGYRTGADRPPVFPPFEGDPDESGLWRVHITGLHPGYPECPRPEDAVRLRRRLAHPGAADDDRRLAKHSARARASVNEPSAPFREFRVIRVGTREEHAFARGGLAAWLATLLVHLPFRHQGVRR